jgi:hypothetical protein
MNLLDRFRRWWKPAQWADDHPLSEAEREAREAPEFFDEASKLGGARFPTPPIDPDDEFRRE